MSNVPVIKFLFQSEWGGLSEALKLNPIYSSEEFKNANDLANYLSTAPGCLVVASLKDKNDLIQIATIVKLAKKVAANCYFKIMIINFSGDKQFEKAAAKLGILDLVEAKIPTKALRFKIDFMMKSVNAQVKKNTSAATSNAVKSLEVAKATEKKNDNLPQWSDPLETEDDIWLLRQDNDCKRVLTRWLIKIMGPSPYVAQWVDSGTAGIWKFEFKSESEEYIFGKGHWYFRGDQKPDFVWSENLWLFTGNSFELFYKDGSVIASRFKLQDRVLSIAQNSEYAKTKETRIIESFDKDLVFKKELQANGEAEKLENETEHYKNLEGKGKTDTLKSGPLSGKGKTSDLSSDPLSMDLKPNENVSNKDPLAQKTETSKEKTHWNGKNSYDQEVKKADFGLASDQNVNNGPELSLENKNKHEKFYKNHNEAEQFEAKELGLHGKSSTDQIEGHLTSANAKAEKAEAKKNDGAYSGNSSTDKLNSHLTSPEAKAKASEEKSSPAEREKQLATPSAAKSPIAKKEGSTAQERENDKKSETRQSAVSSSSERKETKNGIESRESTSAPQASQEAETPVTGKVLPFKPTAPENLDDAIHSAKVTSFLIQDAVKVECHLDDYFDQTIIFCTKKSGITESQTVMLNLNFNYMNKDTNLKFNGNVTQIDIDGEGSHYITVEISQENESAFNAFMKLYGTRQENINLFLKTVKGY